MEEDFYSWFAMNEETLDSNDVSFLLESSSEKSIFLTLDQDISIKINVVGGSNLFIFLNRRMGINFKIFSIQKKGRRDN